MDTSKTDSVQRSVYFLVIVLLVHGSGATPTQPFRACPRSPAVAPLFLSDAVDPCVYWLCVRGDAFAFECGARGDGGVRALWVGRRDPCRVPDMGCKATAPPEGKEGLVDAVLSSSRAVLFNLTDAIADTHIPGGTLLCRQSQACSLPACIRACSSMTGCEALDYNLLGQSCYLHTAATACNPRQRILGVQHYTSAECPTTPAPSAVLTTTQPATVVTTTSSPLTVPTTTAAPATGQPIITETTPAAVSITPSTTGSPAQPGAETTTAPLIFTLPPTTQSVFTSPQPVFTSPQPVFTSPQPVFTSPQPVFTSPQPVFTSPQPVITSNPVFTTPPPYASVFTTNPVVPLSTTNNGIFTTRTTAGSTTTATTQTTTPSSVTRTAPAPVVTTSSTTTPAVTITSTTAPATISTSGGLIRPGLQSLILQTLSQLEPRIGPADGKNTDTDSGSTQGSSSTQRSGVQQSLNSLIQRIRAKAQKATLQKANSLLKSIEVNVSETEVFTRKSNIEVSSQAESSKAVVLEEGTGPPNDTETFYGHRNRSDDVMTSARNSPKNRSDDVMASGRNSPKNMSDDVMTSARNSPKQGLKARDEDKGVLKEKVSSKKEKQISLWPESNKPPSRDIFADAFVKARKGPYTEYYPQEAHDPPPDDNHVEDAADVIFKPPASNVKLSVAAAAAMFPAPKGFFVQSAEALPGPTMLPPGWSAYPGFSVSGAALGEPVSSGDACFTRCIERGPLECEAVDFDSLTGSCWFHSVLSSCNPITPDQPHIYHAKIDQVYCESYPPPVARSPRTP